MSLDVQAFVPPFVSAGWPSLTQLIFAFVFVFGESGYHQSVNILWDEGGGVEWPRYLPEEKRGGR